MNIVRRAFLSLFLLSLLSATGVLADELFLQSGDKLTGTVVAKKGKNIVFRTRGGDEVSFLWKNVKEVKCDSVVVSGKDGKVQEGSFVITTNPGAVGERTISKADVKMLNPEPWRLGRGWNRSGNVNFSLVSERGNTDKDTTDLDASFTVRNLDHRFAASAVMENDATDGIETQSKWFLDGRYDHFIGKKSYYSAAYSFRNDKFANLKLRSTVGGGLGYQILDRDEVALFTEMLLVHVWENSADDVGEDYIGGMLQVKWDRELLSDRLALFLIGAGTVNLTKIQDYFTDVTLGVRTPLFWGVVGTAEVSHEFDSEPKGDAMKADSTYRIKLGYRW